MDEKSRVLTPAEGKTKKENFSIGVKGIAAIILLNTLFFFFVWPVISGTQNEFERGLAYGFDCALFLESDGFSVDQQQAEICNQVKEIWDQYKSERLGGSQNES